MQPKLSVKCIKCKSSNVRVIELWKDFYITWRNGETKDDGVLETGDPYKVEAECLNCNKKWTVRKIKRINKFSWIYNFGSI